MTHENIMLQYPNFCAGPQDGTMCTIDSTNVNAVLKIKTIAGSTVVDYTLTSSITNELIGVEYVGPTNLVSLIDGLTFFTVEKVNTSQCIIKRWETRISFSQLYLKEQVVKYSTGNSYYDVTAFAVEYYNRVFTVANAGNSGPLEFAQYLEMNSVDGVVQGTKLFLGPSTDANNVGATEQVTVSSVVQCVDGYRVYLTSPVCNQFSIGDPIYLYTNLYLYSKQAYGNDPRFGTVYKFDTYSWNEVEADSKGIYKNVTTARWCPVVRGIASVIGSNLLFVRPYSSYSNWKSLFLKNYEQNNVTMYEVYDVVFKAYSVYKLQDKTTLRNAVGTKETFEWETYNYQEDTLLPYTDSINMWMDRSILTGHLQTERINVQVRDQYNVTLRDVNVNLYIKPGDMGAYFDPLDGYGITDINGKVAIDYLSGTTYEGHTLITCKADKSSTSTGSEFVWNSNNFVSSLWYSEAVAILTKLDLEIDMSVKQIGLWYENYRSWSGRSALPEGKDQLDWFKPEVWVVQKSFFTTPGGEWVRQDSGSAIPMSLLEEWLPELYREGRYDAPRAGAGCAYPFSNWDAEGYCLEDPEQPYPICNQIKLISEFESINKIDILKDFIIYETVDDHVVGFPPYVRIKLPDETNTLQISQLKLSKHTHWVDGVAYDYLWTYDDIDQFVFVSDARPVFWSSKNPITTDIWLRLRPFVFSLDPATLKMWVKEVSYVGDTGYYEVTDQLVFDSFPAGGGAVGYEVTYVPTEDFHHNAVVFVRLEVYDIAAIPNLIELAYNFNVIPDYKFPFLTDLSPGREEDYVSVDTEISFHIWDIGTGVDLETLECYINFRLIHTDYLTILKYSRYHYKVVYSPPNNLYYAKTYKMTVKVCDSSPYANKMNESWNFYTTESSGVKFIDFDPIRCKRGVSKFSSVSVLALGDGSGVDKGSIKLQVLDKDVDVRKIPIVYRVS